MDEWKCEHGITHPHSAPCDPECGPECGGQDPPEPNWDELEPWWVLITSGTKAPAWEDLPREVKMMFNLGWAAVIWPSVEKVMKRVQQTHSQVTN